jgi:acetyl esterase/lipase
MVSLRARIVAGFLRAVYKPGLYARLTGDDRARHRGGGLEVVARRPPKGCVVRLARAGDVPCAWIAPLKPRAAPTIFYLHGGGYTSGTLTHYTAMLGLFAREYGFTTLYVDYRLAPLNTFPAAVDDALTAYRWLLESTPPEQIVFIGDSAGGGLVAAALLSAREIGVPQPAAAILLSPWADLEGTGDSLVTRKSADPMLRSPQLQPSGGAYLGGADPRHPLASPIYGDLRGLPPLLIEVGDNEILLDDSRRLADRARADSVNVTLHEWPEIFHVFPIFPHLMPEARDADEEIARFVLAHAQATVPVITLDPRSSIAGLE